MGDNVKKTNNGIYFSEKNEEYFSGSKREFSIKITSLNIRHLDPYLHLDEVNGKNESCSLEGEAVLQRDCGVTVIGSLEEKINSFHVSILSETKKKEAKEFSPRDESRKKIKNRHTAVMGFFERKIGTDDQDEGYIELYVAQELLESLIAIIRLEKFDSVEVRILFETLYIHHFDKDKSRFLAVSWFLIPSEDGDPSFPQAAEGFIKSFIISEKPIKNWKKNITAKQSDLNSKVNCYFEFSAVCVLLLENYSIFQKITELKDSLESRPEIIETLRRDTFYVFMLCWTEIFCNEDENLSWKKIFGDNFKDDVLKKAQILEEEWSSIRNNAKYWRDNVIAHFDLKYKSKGSPRKEDLKAHLKIVIIAYEYAYKKIDEMSAFDAEALRTKATYANPNNILESYLDAAEKLKLSLASLAEK